MVHPIRTKNLDLSEVLKLNNWDVKRLVRLNPLEWVLIDEKLNREEQFRHTKGKMSGCLAALKRLKDVILQFYLCNVYYALIESHLCYADAIWGSLSKTKIATLQRLQDRPCWIITNARIKDGWSTSWLNVENPFRYDRNVMTYKIMNSLCPENLWDKYQRRSFHSTYNTRQCEDVQIPRYWTEFTKKAFIMQLSYLGMTHLLKFVNYWH